MSGLIRIGVSRCLQHRNTGIKSLLMVKTIDQAQRTISSKLIRERDADRPPKPKPWPYNDKSYTILNYFFDKTTARLDDNSKIVVVEGPVAAGKSKFAQELADELDMLYMPEANLDMLYINSYGYDLRKLDEELPAACRSFDINNFLVTPKHNSTAWFQIRQYQVKYSQYIDALAHVLSTGQGVVLDRSVYSDFVFVEAMLKQGYLSKAAKKVYYEIRDNTIFELLRPHLVIYLDVPVNNVLQNIKKRALPYEVNSPVLTPEYLGTMEYFYKQKYLKEINKHAELLVYDWSDGGEVEVIVEDIERIPFTRSDNHDPKFQDWTFKLEEDWAVARHNYADKKDFLMTYLNVPAYQVPELVWEADDAQDYHNAMAAAPGQSYEKGFNSNMGDSGLFIKSKGRVRDTLPLRERRQFV